jgi:diadenosine tetraphosphatase ApaH/serine/threonine PP2A family protein phosphatase
MNDSASLPQPSPADTAGPIAVLSDVHGNLEALREVLRDLDARGAGTILNLGDMVGYGPEPEACVRLLRERGALSVLGNHELGLVEAGARGWFNPQAKRALDRTRALVSEDSLEYFRTLPRAIEFAGALCVHGCPPALVTRYLYELDEAELRECFGMYANSLCFVGHTHELERISLLPGQGRAKVVRKALRGGRLALNPLARHLVNAGAVGQPRDGDNRAKYILWEPAADGPGAPGTIEVRYIPYDIARTAAGILEKGLPAVYADRLW